MGFSPWKSCRFQWFELKHTVDGCEILHHQTDGWTPNKIMGSKNHLSTGAGFLPSTVWNQACPGHSARKSFPSHIHHGPPWVTMCQLGDAATGFKKTMTLSYLACSKSTLRESNMASWKKSLIHGGFNGTNIYQREIFHCNVGLAECIFLR